MAPSLFRYFSIWLGTGTASSQIQAGLKRLENLELKGLGEFFGLFPVIYALTSAPPALARAAHGVLGEFLDGDTPQCTYLELRSTPRATPDMTRAEQPVLILSLNGTMDEQEVEECIGIARDLKAKGRRIVGVDLCGDPLAGDMNKFATYFANAKRDGLGITLHIAETEENTSADTLRLLGFQPDRLGHATFLDNEAKTLVLKNKPCIEICLSSNLLPTTFFPSKLRCSRKYALLLAQAPLGLGLSEIEVERIAGMSMANRMQTSID
ncbi:Metallo-dependent hydrolase [Mycena vitilis]|nr:Metallo-dependent hydrolase [Mycena vitilis]